VLPQISSLVQVEEEHRQGSLKAIVAHEFPKATVVVYEPKCSAGELAELVNSSGTAIDSNSQVVFFTYNAHLYKDQLTAISELRAKTSRIAVVALRNPYDLSGCKNIATCAATFGFRTPAVQAILRVFKGETKPQSHNWPVSIAGWGY
jgi:beta-N-acetylhexosaminidase